MSDVTDKLFSRCEKLFQEREALRTENKRLTAERDALRELLREAYPHVWPGERALADSLRARIDALLDKGGGDDGR